jgi:hypothetical protein
MSAPSALHGDSADRRPKDASSGKPLPQREQPGYYAGFSTLAQQKYWDEATRRKVLDRVYKVPPIRFFSPEEVALMEAIAAHLLPQDDRMPSRRIPLIPGIDHRLHTGRTSGYRFAEMPPDGVAYRLGLQAIERMSEKNHGKAFRALSWREQDELLKSIHDAQPKEGAADIWARMPVHRFWALILQDCADVYYAHPWAWDEIGFGGPAYPRGYMRLENGEPEPWEVEEQRYEWEAPPDCVSDPKGADVIAHGGHPPSAQGGTH